MCNRTPSSAARERESSGQAMTHQRLFSTKNGVPCHHNIFKAIVYFLSAGEEKGQS